MDDIKSSNSEELIKRQIDVVTSNLMKIKSEIEKEKSDLEVQAKNIESLSIILLELDLVIKYLINQRNQVICQNVENSQLDRELNDAFVKEWNENEDLRRVLTFHQLEI